VSRLTTFHRELKAFLYRLTFRDQQVDSALFNTSTLLTHLWLWLFRQPLNHLSSLYCHLNINIHDSYITLCQVPQKCLCDSITLIGTFLLLIITTANVSSPCSCAYGMLNLSFLSLNVLVSDSTRRSLRSADVPTCVVPRTLSSYGDRTFAAAGHGLWNSLPVQLRNPDITYGLFRWQLKGHIFREAWTRRSVTSDTWRFRKNTYLLTYLTNYLNDKDKRRPLSSDHSAIFLRLFKSPLSFFRREILVVLVCRWNVTFWDVYHLRPRQLHTTNQCRQTVTFLSPLRNQCWFYNNVTGKLQMAPPCTQTW